LEKYQSLVKALLLARGDLLRLTRAGGCLVALALFAFASCEKNEPIDEAKAAGLTTADIFKPMDGRIDLSPEEIMGRNTWNLWSGDNQNFCSRVAQGSTA